MKTIIFSFALILFLSIVSAELDIIGDETSDVIELREIGDILTFLGLTDTPSTYAGSGGYCTTVKASEDGLELTPCNATSSTNCSQCDDRFIAISNESNLNVNSSVWWVDVSDWVEDWLIKTGNSLDFNESKLATIYYNATHASILVGTIDGGTLGDTQHPDGNYDDRTFNFSEAAGSPALDMKINFTNIDDFNQGIMRYKTSSLTGDFPIIQMWDYDDLAWEDYPYVAESETFATITQPVFDSSDHIGTGADAGIAQMRIYKASNGNINNHYYVDWIAIAKGYGTPSGVEVDPFSLHKDGTTELTGDWNYGSYEINGSRDITTLGGIFANSFNVTDSHTYVGVHSGQGSVGADPTFVGIWSGKDNTGNDVAFVGNSAGDTNSGDEVVGFGYSAGNENTGSYSNFIGSLSGNQNQGNRSIGIGYEALDNNLGNDVVAIGYQAGKSNSFQDQFIIQQANINAVPLIQGNFSSGHVGIGTGIPTHTLNVVGGINATKNITTDSHFVGSGAYLINVPTYNATYDAYKTNVSFGDIFVNETGDIMTGDLNVTTNITVPIIQSDGATSVFHISPNSAGDGAPMAYQSGIGVKFFEEADNYVAHNDAANENPVIAFYGASNLGQKYATIGMDDYRRLKFSGTMESTVFETVLISDTGIEIGGTVTTFIDRNLASGVGNYHTTFGGSDDAQDEPVWVLTRNARKDLNFGVTSIGYPQLWIHDGSATAGNYIRLYHNGVRGLIRSNVGDLNLSADGLVVVDEDMNVYGNLNATCHAGVPVEVIMTDNSAPPNMGYYTYVATIQQAGNYGIYQTKEWAMTNFTVGSRLTPTCSIGDYPVFDLRVNDVSKATLDLDGINNDGDYITTTFAPVLISVGDEIQIYVDDGSGGLWSCVAQAPDDTIAIASGVTRCP